MSKGLRVNTYSNSVNTNLVNTVDLNAETATISNIIIDNFDIPEGQAYKIGGVHVLSTRVQASSIALGNTEPVSQGPQAIAVGINSGESNQNNSAISIVTNSGQTDQGAQSVSIGTLTGQTNQGSNSVAIGTSAGQTNQGDVSVAVGSNAGLTNQGSGSIAIGHNAGSTDQGLNSICIGENAQSPGFNGTIVLGVDALAGADSEFVIGSDTVPVLVSGSAGPPMEFLFIRVNGFPRNIQLYNDV